MKEQKKRSKHEYSTFAIVLFIFVLSTTGVVAAAISTLQEVTEQGATTNMTVSFLAENLYINKTWPDNTLLRVYNNDAKGSTGIVLKNDYNGEKSLNLLTYGKNTTFGTIGQYNKNETVRMWSVNSHFVIGTFTAHDLALATDDIPALIIDGTTGNTVIIENLEAEDGSVGYTGNCSTTLEVKQGIVVGCI